MEHAPYHDLLALCDAFASHLNISHWRVSFLARGDGQFFRRLMTGGGCTVKTAVSVTAWFDAHWPADLAWPPSVPRPSKSKKEVA